MSWHLDSSHDDDDDDYDAVFDVRNSHPTKSSTIIVITFK